MFGAAAQEKLMGSVQAMKGDNDGVGFGSLLSLVAKVFQDGSLSADDLPELSEFAQTLFDTFVVPYDIPFIDGVAELAAEGALRAYIPTLVEDAWELWSKEDVEPGDPENEPLDDAPEEEDGAADGA